MTDIRNHPEHDLLAALAQDLLTKSERNTVLSHLAECSECRRVVMFLAETERLPKPKLRRRAWLHLTFGAAAAVAIIFLAFGSWPSTVLLPENRSAPTSTAYSAAWNGRSFRHVKLTSQTDSSATDALTIHLAGFRPKGNQVVVRSQFGDRWLTFDSFLSLAANDGSVSTVN